jgi:hypothetical protein
VAQFERDLGMRLHQWWLFGALAFAPLLPTQNAHAVTVTGTASFLDTGPFGNGLFFNGVFNPSNAFNLDLTYGSPVTVANFLTIKPVNNNWAVALTATDTITTTFNLTQPEPASGSVTGTGTVTSLFFVFDHGNIHWNGPTTINFGNGLDLTIALSDASFLSLFAGIFTPYPSVGIDATFSLSGTNATVSQAPLPAAAPLFATGLGAIGLLGWWRRKRQRAFASVTG